MFATRRDLAPRMARARIPICSKGFQAVVIIPKLNQPAWQDVGVIMGSSWLQNQHFGWKYALIGRGHCAATDSEQSHRFPAATGARSPSLSVLGRKLAHWVALAKTGDKLSSNSACGSDTRFRVCRVCCTHGVPFCSPNKPNVSGRLAKSSTCQHKHQ